MGAFTEQSSTTKILSSTSLGGYDNELNFYSLVIALVAYHLLVQNLILQFVLWAELLMISTKILFNSFDEKRRILKVL